MKLDGKVAIVTGGGQGIGQGIALALAKEGADIVVADVDPKSARDVAAQIESLGRRAQVIKVDVSNSQEVDELVKKTLDSFGKIDILVNNAGIDLSLTLSVEAPEAEWDRMINVNLKGVFLCSQIVGRQMIEQKKGKIVNIASVAGHRGFLGKAAYCASKGGVLQLTKVFAIEWAKYGINVNAVCPGTVRTALVEKLPINLEDRAKRTPSKRLNKPEDIANAVVFLASPDSDNIIGQDIIVDGGVSALFWPEGE